MSNTTSFFNQNYSFEDIEFTRQTLTILMAEDKIRKSNQLLAQETEQLFKLWESSVLSYIEIIEESNSFINLYGKQLRWAGMRKLIKTSSASRALIFKHLDSILVIVERFSSRNNVNTESITVLKNQQERINRIINLLTPLDCHKSNRRSAKTIHQIKKLLELINQRICSVGNALPNIAQTQIEFHSKSLDLIEELASCSSD